MDVLRRLLSMRAPVYVLAAALVVAVLVLALVPRYEIHTLGTWPASVRLDRWTGRVDAVMVTRPTASTYQVVVQPVSEP